jgi:hypothetical protein
MSEQPEASSALRNELESRLGVTLASSGFTDAARGTDEFIVDAYEATFWRIATMAAWERRPIAIDGALQGPDWLTVCVPSVDIRFASEPAVVDPRGVWNRLQPTILKRDSYSRPAEFFVKPASIPDRTHERDDLNLRFRRDPTAGFFPDREAPVSQRRTRRAQQWCRYILTE